MARSIVERAIGAPLIPKAPEMPNMEVQENQETIRQRIRRTKQDLFDMSTMYERHTGKAAAEEIEGRKDGNIYRDEKSRAEMIHRRIVELREVITDLESRLLRFEQNP